MISPQEAFSKAKKARPSASFSGDCVDYRGCWVFPYSERNNNVAKRIFVDKETGFLMTEDPAFDVELWNKSRNLKDEIELDISMEHKFSNPNRMRYRCIFESPGETLAHHGVKGMKWGKWNLETQARYAGGANGGGGGGLNESDSSGGGMTDEELDAYAKRYGLSFHGMNTDQKYASLKNYLRDYGKNRIMKLFQHAKMPSGEIVETGPVKKKEDLSKYHDYQLSPSELHDRYSEGGTRYKQSKK